MTADLLALLDSDPAAGILALADQMEHDASLCSFGEGPFLGADPDDGARLVEWMLAAVRRWRGVVERHVPNTAPRSDEVTLCMTCRIGRWPCPDLTETADEACAYLGGAA